MINKFKKGGLNTSILAKIQLLPKELQQQVMQAFSQWALQKGVDIQKLQKDPNALEQALGQFMQELQSQKTQAARHGAKLNYLKSLKNKCAEDEELVYFKKGGSIDCGCKKKEVGGKVLSAQNGAVAKFKMQKGKKFTNVNSNDTVHVNGKVYSTTNSDGTPVDKRFPAYSGKVEEKDRKSAKAGNKDAKKRLEKLDLTSSEKKGGSIIKTFKEKCGSKLKKHQLGGSLNSIPFMQKGSSFKEAWNNARKNKVRYFNYNGRMYNSKAKGVDNEYNTFRDNMNEMSALLPTDNSPKHLGWERNNPISNELRGGDRQIRVQGTESTLPGITVTGNFKTKKTPTRLSVKSEVYYNMPLGRIEYIGRDGLKYWMAQSDANGLWYYDKIENSANYGPKYHKAVPEGYIIPGTNIPITKNSKIGKIGLGLKKKWMKNGGSLNGIPFIRKEKQLPTAPKAEDRYKNGYKYGYRSDGSLYLFPNPLYTIADIKGVRTDYPFMSNLGEIQRTIFYAGDSPMDTVYTEIPNSVLPVERKLRYANSKNKTPEYETLKRRFNTAWNLAK